MKTIRFIVLIGLVTFTGMQAQARNYGAGGCGLGTLVVGKEGSQVLAATTNGTSGSQTFGITSGTSNCKDGANTAMNMKYYVEANKVALANDIARGNGDTVTNLAQIAGCKDTEAFAVTMQKNYSVIYPSQEVDAQVVSNSILSTIQADEKLAASCI
jgi:hypothetical protein